MKIEGKLENENEKQEIMKAVEQGGAKVKGEEEGLGKEKICKGNRKIKI